MPVSPPLTVKESDDSVTVRPANVLSFNAADFTVAGSGDTATISIDSTGTGAALTDTYIGFGNASNLLTGSANFTFTEESGGSGPSVLLTGDKPVMRFTDDTGATNYTMRFTQSGSSFYMAHEDSAGTDNGMFRISASYVALMPTIQPRVGIGGYGDSGVALTIVDDGTDTMLRLESTDVGASVAPIMELFRNSASPADGDSLGSLSWQFQDDGGGKNEAGYIKAYISDASAGTEDADFYWYGMSGGSLYNLLSVRGGIRAVEVNVNEADVDFLANGDTVGELLHVDASQDNIGIGGSPDSGVERLEVKGTGTDTLVRLTSTDVGATNAPDLELFRDSPSPATADYTGAIKFSGYEDTAASSKVDYARIDTRMFGLDATESGVLTFYTRQNNALRPQMSASQTGVTFNENNEAGFDFKVETDLVTNFFYIDSGQNNCGIGATPDSGVERLHVTGTGTGTLVMLESTAAGSSASPDLVFYRSVDPGADDNYISQVSYVGRNDNSQDVTYFKQQARILDATDGSEDGGMYSYIMDGGTLRRVITMTSSGMYINNDGYDFNFAVNDDNDDALLNCDAGLRVVSVGSTAAVSGGATLQVPNNTISSYCNIKSVRSDSVATQLFTNEDCQGQLWINTSATAWTLQLPEGGVKGMWFRFVSTNGDMDVDPLGSDTLNGGTATLSRDTDNEIYTVICIDSGVWILSNPN